MPNAPSPMQADIFKAVRKGDCNLLVKAGAGTGKTTTSMGSLDYVGDEETVCMLAFNVKIAEEMRNRIGALNRERMAEGEAPVKAEARTINSEGMRACKRGGFSDKVDGRKPWTLARAVVPYAHRNVTASVVALMKAARTHGMVPSNFDVELDRAGFPKATGLIPDDLGTWHNLAKRYDIELSKPRPIEIDYARSVLRKSILDSKVLIDFDDQIYLPLIFNLPMQRYSWVFVDEAQDLNDANIEMISRIADRFMFVGDDSQSLYAFRGADADAMDKIRNRFQCKVLPLSVTYRCPASVVREANKYDPTLLAAPGAPEGEVVVKGDARSAEYKPGDMVLCRFNAPLLSLAFALIARGIPLRIQGRDIVPGIMELVEKVGGNTIEDLLKRLGPWTRDKIVRLQAADDDVKAMALLDKVQMLVAVVTESGRVNHIHDIKEVMEDLFREDGEEGVTLSSIHRAKGLEADVIWWLNPNIAPKVKPGDFSAQKQEMNARYVATTRAKKSLYFVSMGGGKKGKKADRIRETLQDVLGDLADATTEERVMAKNTFTADNIPTFGAPPSDINDFGAKEVAEAFNLPPEGYDADYTGESGLEGGGDFE